MIVLTSVDTETYHVQKGDLFNLSVYDDTGTTIVISETITQNAKINFIASYRFALESGKCPNFHLCGIFGNSKSLPKEIQDAVRFDDLDSIRKENFLKSINIKIKD